jgi:hypothetical protein
MLKEHTMDIRSMEEGHPTIRVFRYPAGWVFSLWIVMIGLASAIWYTQSFSFDPRHDTQIAVVSLATAVAVNFAMKTWRKSSDALLYAVVVELIAILALVGMAH